VPSFPITDPVLIVAVAMAIFLVAPLLAQRGRLPGIIGLILAGAIVGPNGLHLLARDQTIILLGTVGLLYLLFMVGIEIDLLGFRRYRARSLTFGAISYLIPQTVGLAVGLLLGYPVATAVLLGSIFGSHTLLAYPIAQRFGISKNTAITTAVGGTIVTDSAALLTLAIVVAATAGALDVAFWARLIVLLTVFVTVIWYGLPRVARWFFRHEKVSTTTEYVFVLTTLFSGAYLARFAGLEPIVGAFLTGLALNRLIPEQSPLTSRINFFGESFFIPFFLLSVGMLVDVRVLLSGVRAWEVMVAMTATVGVTKLAAAQLGRRMFGYTAAEGWAIYGLTVPQAAATLAVTLVGVAVGLFDDAILNGAIMMVLATCVLGPWLVDRYGRAIALEEQQKPFDPKDAPQRLLVPIANPATARGLLDLALLIRDPDSTQPIYPVTVVPGDVGDTAEHVATAEKMLAGSVAYLAGAGVPVLPLTRVDENFARGIERAIAETRGTTLVVGWDGRPSLKRRVFGTVLDRLLEVTDEQLLVTKLGHPLNTTERLIVLVPRGSDHLPGFFEAVRSVKLLANRLGATIHGFAVAPETEPYAEHFEAVRPTAPVSFEHVGSWDIVLQRLPDELRADDLVVVLSARQGAVSWDQTLDRLPGLLARLVPESFVMLYPAEVRAAQRLPVAAPPVTHVAVPVLAPQRILVDAEPGPVEELVRSALEIEFADDRERLARILRDLSRGADPIVAEIRPGAAVAQARTDAVSEPLLFLVRVSGGVRVEPLAEPVCLLFILISRRADAHGHLRALAEIGRMVSEERRYRQLRDARSTADVEAAIALR
jgi:Kef-type K+ transport system membrane component KefB/mannitol/fructose-specific phosphotransferase system IIA component (Ntr-type)